jgi:hypothetical protein
MSCGQVLLRYIQRRVADRDTRCPDQLPRRLVWVPGQLIHLGSLPELTFAEIGGAVYQLIGGTARQRLLLEGEQEIAYGVAHQWMPPGDSKRRARGDQQGAGYCIMDGGAQGCFVESGDGGQKFRVCLTENR